MIRVFLFYLLPILLPSLLYFCWVKYTHKSGESEPEETVPVRQMPWFTLIFSGIVLMIAGLFFAGFTGGMDPGGQYQAPYAKDGKIIPGRMVPKGE